jgi:hypothetical protein
MAVDALKMLAHFLRGGSASRLRMARINRRRESISVSCKVS